MNHLTTRLASFFCLTFLGASFASAQTASFSVPSLVQNDNDNLASSPWLAEGTPGNPLLLTFDTQGTIPANATIQAVRIRITGVALGPSYRSEIDLRLVDPDGSQAQWDFG